MSYFVENPSFWAEFNRGLLLALGDRADEIADDATTDFGRYGKAEARPGSIDAQGPHAIVRISKGLGTIYNRGARDRRLKGKGKYPAGTYRGSVDATHSFDDAVERGVSKGLDLSRYL